MWFWSCSWWASFAERPHAAPTAHGPADGAGQGRSALGRRDSMRRPMLRLAGKSNGAFRNGKTSWVWTSTPVEVPCLRVNNKSKLDILAATLLEKEVIYKEDLERVFGKRTWDKEENEKLVNVPVEEVIAIKAEEKPSQENSPA